MHHLRRFRHARKFGDGIEEVNEQGCNHHEKRGAESKFFANQVGEAFPGDHPHTRAHFLADVQCDGHRNQRPQERVAELRARLRVGADPAGVVIHV